MFLSIQIDCSHLYFPGSIYERSSQALIPGQVTPLMIRKKQNAPALFLLQAAGLHGLKLEWESPSRPAEVIPFGAFSPNCVAIGAGVTQISVSPLPPPTLPPPPPPSVINSPPGPSAHSQGILTTFYSYRDRSKPA